MWALVPSALTHFWWRRLQNFLQALLQDLTVDLESWAVEKISAHVSGNAASRVSHGRKFVTRNKQITTEKQSSSRRHVSASRSKTPCISHLACLCLTSSTQRFGSTGYSENLRSIYQTLRNRARHVSRTHEALVEVGLRHALLVLATGDAPHTRPFTLSTTFPGYPNWMLSRIYHEYITNP